MKNSFFNKFRKVWGEKFYCPCCRETPDKKRSNRETRRKLKQELKNNENN